MGGGSVLVMAVFVATFIEWIVERLFGAMQQLKGYPMVLISSAIGIVLCFGLHIDILELLGFVGDYPYWVGATLSGIIIGAGSNAIHKFVDPTR